MNITPIPNNRQNFGSVNIIQVSKKAFKNPEDLNSVCDEFSKAISNITGETNNAYVSALINFVGLGKKCLKSVNFLESPGHANVINDLKEAGGHSIDWLSQYTGIKIPKPMSENHHSFFILTEQQKDAAYKNIFSIKNIINLAINASIEDKARVKSGAMPELGNVRISARIHQQLIEKIKPIIKNEPIHKAAIDDLSQLPKVFEQIDY